MSKLKIIDLNSNQIESMSSDILKPVMNLMCVDFRRNGSLNAFLKPRTSGSEASMEELLKIIDANCTKLANIESIPPNQHDLSFNSQVFFVTAQGFVGIK